MLETGKSGETEAALYGIIPHTMGSVLAQSDLGLGAGGPTRQIKERNVFFSFFGEKWSGAGAGQFSVESELK